MQHYKGVFVLIGLVACLAQAALPQCHQPSSESINLLSSGDRSDSVILTLIVGRAGGAHDVKVVYGPTWLTSAAIKAAKARRYKPQISSGRPHSREMTVAVKFPLDGSTAPTVQEIITEGIGGVRGCVPAGQPLGFMLPPWSGVLPQSLIGLLRVQPTMPVLAPKPAK